MYFIEITAKAKRDLKKIPKPHSTSIIKKLYELRENPFSKVTRLEGTKLWRLRIQDYRAILDILIEGKRIIVLRIGHRKNIYDKI